MPSARMNRFQSFTPLRESTTGSLRRLKTAFSPVRRRGSNSSMHSRSHSASTIRTSTTTSSASPLTRNCSPASYRSSSSAGSLMNMLAIRQRPSLLEDEMENEKLLFGNELDVLEPRPSIGFGALNSPELHVVGIFEVLDGKC